MITCVHHGVRNRLVLTEILDQSSDKFRNPMPPKPPPMKLATLLRGATQQRNASEPSMGKTNSGRNCHRMTAVRTAKKILICLRERRVGFWRCFFCVSKRAAWQRLHIRWLVDSDTMLMTLVRLTLGTCYAVSFVYKVYVR